MSDGKERGTSDFAALFGGWKYKEPEPLEPKVLKEYANGAVKVLSTDSHGNKPTSTVITTDQGTVTVYRSLGVLSLTIPYLGISLVSERVNRLLHVEKAAPLMDIYTIHDNDEYVGIATGPNIDLGLAQALGIEDQDLQRDATDSSVEPRIATRIKTTFLFSHLKAQEKR